MLMLMVTGYILGQFVHIPQEDPEQYSAGTWHPVGVISIVLEAALDIHWHRGTRLRFSGVRSFCPIVLLVVTSDLSALMLMYVLKWDLPSRFCIRFRWLS
ncbi:MAG: hypothetical protein R3B47_03510 [Bacteroidia bacterium]